MNEDFGPTHVRTNVYGSSLVSWFSGNLSATAARNQKLGSKEANVTRPPRAWTLGAFSATFFRRATFELKNQVSLVA
jgi:hypothetical protein